MDIYQTVTDRIIAELTKGCVPWHKPWNAATNMPRNLHSKREYRGVNIWLLNAMSYESPWWASYRQIQEMGGNVRKGEKASIVVFFKMVPKKQADDPEAVPTASGLVPILRYYSIFNSCQCDGLVIPESEERINEFTPIQEATRIIHNMPCRPTIRHGGNRAYFSVTEDMIQMPPQHSFDTAEDYASTLNHEAIHATMAEHRLNRKASIKVHRWGDEAYAREELVAELGSAFLCAIAGIENRTIAASASYIEGWLKALQNDKKLIVVASAQAQKAADYILDRQGGDGTDVTEDSAA
jgi:antirestriction protein ArdC